MIRSSCSRRLRRVLISVLAPTAVLSVMVLSGGPSRVEPPARAVAPAADVSTFRPGNLISDAVFFDSSAMNAAQIQSFLNGEVPTCTAGYTCLKNYQQTTVTRVADSFCRGTYTGAANETAAIIIAKVATACGINPRVLLVTLQKEQGLVTDTWPVSDQYRKAMGYGCPDTGAGCDATYYGLFNQLYSAAKQFQRYAANPDNYSFAPGSNIIGYYPRGSSPGTFNYQNASCGTADVYIENQATAGLYNYTPYVPNSAALAAGYGRGDTCSSYGNRNFWLYFTDWFGSTQTGGRDVDAPIGNLDAVTAGVGQLTVGGWAYDPNATTTSIQVHVYVDGGWGGALTANTNRPDVGAAFPGIGNTHGYSGTVSATPGLHTACTYAVNVGAGYSNPLLGCKTVNVLSPATRNPIGNLEMVSASSTTVSVAGWAYDPDVPTTPIDVHIYADGAFGTRLSADSGRPDVGRAFPGAGSVHGFSGSILLGSGAHSVCAYAINQGAGTTNPLLGCKTVAVGGPPFGHLELATTSADRMRLAGWAIDPDTTGPATVVVTVNGIDAASVPAGNARSDVGRAFPTSGSNHGFDTTVSLSSASNRVCVSVIDIPGTARKTLGCRTVTLDAVPRGALNGITTSGTTADVVGWAYDPDTTASIDVHLYVDGRFAQVTPASVPRADIALAFPPYGSRHGFDATLTLSTGTHQVCAFAINVMGGGTNPLLGCSTVTARASAAVPVGNLDAVTVSGTTATASGWALDPDVPTSPVVVHIYVDGRWTAATTASGWRPDIAMAFPGAGAAHGFSQAVTVGPGTHQICAYAINQAGGNTNSLLRCSSVTVP